MARGPSATATRSTRRRTPVVGVGVESASGPSAILGGLPAGVRDELVRELNKIERNYREGRWEAAELDGGRLCEIVYSIVKGHLDGAMPPRSSRPANMVKAILALESYPTTAGPRSMRVTIPRVMLGILDIRNDRDVGHIGGEVPSNHMDATYVINGAKWLVAELIRTFHKVDTVTATNFVEALVARATPDVWVVGDVKRVIAPGLSMRDRTLVLLHATPGPVLDTTLRNWVEYSNLSVFREKILQGAHDDNLIHYDRRTGLVHLSPVGSRYVEARLGASIT